MLTLLSPAVTSDDSLSEVSSKGCSISAGTVLADVEVSVVGAESVGGKVGVWAGEETCASAETDCAASLLPCLGISEQAETTKLIIVAHMIRWFSITISSFAIPPLTLIITEQGVIPV